MIVEKGSHPVFLVSINGVSFKCIVTSMKRELIKRKLESKFQEQKFYGML